jgi:predicted permease
MRGMLSDIRFSLRLLRKSPVFAGAAVLSLALGIGAATTVFSAFRAVFLRPLPFARPARLVEILKALPAGQSPYPTITDVAFWKRFSRSFESIGEYASYRPMTLLGTAEPESVFALEVEKDLFPTLRARPLMGRVFEAADFENGNPRSVLLAWKTWREDFNGEPRVIGRRVTLNDRSFWVIGVMPADFRYPNTFPHLWIADRDGVTDAGTATRGVVARLKPGVPLESARAELERLRPALAQLLPESKRNFHIEMARVGEQDAAPYRYGFLLLCGAAGTLALIASLNMAALMLARNVTREGEFAIRSALGAARWRLVRHAMAESLLLAGGGGLCGICLAWAGNRALLAWLPAHYGIARLSDTRMDLAALLFAFTLASMTALIFGAGPALVLSRLRPQEFSRTMTPNRNAVRWRGALVVSEMALSLMLLIGAGLLIRSFVTLANVNPGFRTDHVLTMTVPFETQLVKDQAKLRQRFTEILARAEGVPGVASAGVTTAIPMGMIEVSMNVKLEERPGQEVPTGFKAVSAGYFGTMGIPLRRGRMFDLRDDAAAPPVAIVNQAFARRYWPGLDPVGRHIDKSITVIGVLADIHNHRLSVADGPEFYQPYLQRIGPSIGAMLVARTHGDPAGMAAALREAIHQAYPNQPVSDIATMKARVADSLAEPRLYTLLLSIFAALAMILSAIGIFGATWYTAGRRTREFGIRMALGAQPASVVWAAIREGLALIAAGSLSGVIAGWALKRSMEHLLFGVKAGDPVAFVCAPALLAAVAAIACWLPARRAASADPNAALREE